MPISIEDFERKPVEELNNQPPPHTDDALVEFLHNHPDRAFTLRELSSQTGAPILDLASRLTNLANKGVVRNRGSYWAITREYAES